MGEWGNGRMEILECDSDGKHKKIYSVLVHEAYDGIGDQSSIVLDLKKRKVEEE